MRGLNLAKEIRGLSETHNSRIPIVALTGHVEEKERQACFLAGMSDVMIKPMRISSLQSILQRWVLTHVD